MLVSISWLYSLINHENDQIGLPGGYANDFEQYSNIFQLCVDFSCELWHGTYGKIRANMTK